MRRTLNIRFLLILIIPIFLLIECKKDEEIEIPTNYVDQDLLDNYLFDSNSYWTYKDQNNQVDSIYVNSIVHDSTGIPCFSCEPRRFSSYQEYFRMNMNSTNQGSFNYFFLSNHFKKDGDEIWDGQPLFSLNMGAGYEFNGMSFEEHYDSLIIGTNIFFDVSKTTISAEDQYEDIFEYDTEHYFSPGIGLVKKVIFNPSGTQTWEIDSWEIN